VRSQLYENWELCIADDCSSSERVREVLEEYRAIEPRIRVTFRSSNGHISEASNSAAALAQGEFLVLLDHDDELRPHALYLVVHKLNQQANLDLIYSDEDKIDEQGIRTTPYFKSSWNPELLLAQNYICHLATIRRSLFEALGGFRKGLEGAQDWDLFLRVSSASTAERIHHIPHVLYHWRATSASTAQSIAAKPYVSEAQRRVVQDHLVRIGDSAAKAEVLAAISSIRVKRQVPEPEPFVSLIIPTKDRVDLLSRCVDGVLNGTSYGNLELLIVDNNSIEAETAVYLASVSQDPRVTVIKDDEPFNYARINNAAALCARGSILGFLNNDIEVVSADWLREMVSQLARDGVGAVGARLLFPTGLVQHAGVVLGIDSVAGHSFYGESKFRGGYFNHAVLAHNVSAVTAACMLVKRSVFDQVRGFDEKQLGVSFNDVDLCLKIREAGELIVYTPYAELVHNESASRGYEDSAEKIKRFEQETALMKSRWGESLKSDPYYNPNLTLMTRDYGLAFPPRSVKPWRA
jgi:GT2 family glycosyltransferase